MTHWLHWEAIHIRVGNPYLEDDVAMEQAVQALRHKYPNIRGTLRHRDGRVISTIDAPQFRIGGAPRAPSSGGPSPA